MAICAPPNGLVSQYDSEYNDKNGVEIMIIEWPEFAKKLAYKGGKE